MTEVAPAVPQPETSSKVSQTTVQEVEQVKPFRVFVVGLLALGFVGLMLDTLIWGRCISFVRRRLGGKNIRYRRLDTETSVEP